MFYVIARFVLRPLFWAVFRPHVRGREHVPLTGPVILASNHLSFIDSIAIPLVGAAEGLLPGQGGVLHRPRASPGG